MQTDEHTATSSVVEESGRAWGAYDRDDPFPVFAALRERGAVHPVTLADGHDAWVVVRYLLDRFPDLRLAVPIDELHWGRGDGLVLRGLSELPVLPGASRR